MAAKLIQVSCNAEGDECCECNSCSSIDAECGCQLRVTASLNAKLDYKNPDYDNYDCGLEYYRGNGRLNSTKKISSTRSSVDLGEQCVTSIRSRRVLCDGDGDEVCCNSSQGDLCTTYYTYSSGFCGPASCSYNGSTQYLYLRPGDATITVSYKFINKGNIEVLGVKGTFDQVLGFNSDGGQGTGVGKITVTSPGGSKDLSVVLFSIPNSNTTLSGSVTITAL